jgi:hypothetical protein
MKKFTLILSLIFTLTCLSQQINFSQNSEIIANPERGFHKFTETNSTNYSLLNSTTLSSYRNGVDKITMIYRGFYLESFINSSISQSYLDKMQQDFNTMRNSGIKGTIRFGYYTTSQTGAYQPTKTQILQHIQQLAPVINANKDVILSVQIGFIGRWGEYYYTNSTEFGNGDYSQYTQTQWNNRKEIVDACLNNFNSSIFIQLRYPYAKTAMYGNSYIPRLGYFNDAFLNVYGDEGFFPICQNCTPSQTQINEVISQTSNNLMSGETNAVTTRTVGSNAIIEMDLYNWSIINRDYYGSVITSWINDGTFTTIINRLGYRFILNSLTYSFNDEQLNLTFNTTNEGFSKILKNKNVYLVLKSSTNTFSFPLSIDVKLWGNTFNESVNLSSLPEDIYQVFLKIEDTDLTNNSLFNVRISNLTWDSFNGLNYLLNLQRKPTGLSIVDTNVLPTINVYPNPTTGIVYLPFNCVYKVYNQSSKLVKSGTRTQFNISNKPAGIYFLKVENYQTVKIVKQ